jgi:hypothetical protein
MDRTSKFVLLGLLLLLSVLLPYEPLLHRELFAISPPFFRQEIMDQPQNDWEVGKLGKDIFSIDTPDGNELSVTMAENKTECLLEQNDVFPSPDIEGVSYFSDGKTLNATVWLSSPFKEHRVNGTLGSASSFKELPWHQMGYTMSIDTISVYDTGATDYYAELKWDHINQTWSKIIYEGSKIGEKREIDREDSYNGFFDNGKRYFLFSIDLNKINYPDQYKVILTSYDNFLNNNNRLCHLYDATSWVHIPPPKFIMTTSPSSTALRPGEAKNIELQIKSDSDLKSNVYLSTDKTDGIEMTFQPNYIFVPPKGMSTSLIQIKALNDADISPHTLPIHAKVYFITEGVLRGGQEITGNPQSGSIAENSNLAIEVLNPLSLQEHFNNFFTGWFTPLTAMYQTISAIIGGVIVWLVAYKKKKGDKYPKYEKTNKTSNAGNNK